MSASVANRFFSVPARYAGRVVARVHSATHSVWCWRAPRAGERPSPACLFWPVDCMETAFGLASAAGAIGCHALVKPATSCAVFSSGPLAGWAEGLIVKIELAPGMSAPAARRLLIPLWLCLSPRV